MSDIVLEDREFELFQRMIYETAGIHMTSAKKALVSGRLAKRVKHHGLASYDEYFRLLSGPASGHEFQIAIDLLTTNETFFFREPKHFEFLCQHILPAQRSGSMRLWSAASSSGEEAYTLAMVMAEHARTQSWEIVGTDISSRVLEKARRGQYPMERTRNIPQNYLKAYCLRGTGSQGGTFLIGKALRERVQFLHANLKSDLSKLGSFDVILLRNVMIYFDAATKQQVVANLLRNLKPGGYLMVGHSESLNGITDDVRLVMPSVYRKP